jgi:hypothetical protein
VQIKNKPCVKFTSVMRLISLIRPRGSETVKQLKKGMHLAEV